MATLKTFMGWAVGETVQNKLHTFQFGKIEKFENGEIVILTPRTPKDPSTIKDKVRVTLSAGDFKLAWKKI